MNQPVIPTPAVNAATTTAGDDPNNPLNLKPFNIIDAPDAHELADQGEKFLGRIKVQDPTAIWGVGTPREGIVGSAAKLPGLFAGMFGKQAYSWFEKHVLSKLHDVKTTGQLHGVGGAPAGGAPANDGMTVSAPSVGGTAMSQISDNAATSPGFNAAIAGLKGAGVGPAVSVSASPAAPSVTPAAAPTGGIKR